MHYRDTFDAAFVISNSAISKKKVEVEDKGGNYGLFEHLMHSWVGYELVKVFLKYGLSPKLRSDPTLAKNNGILQKVLLDS